MYSQLLFMRYSVATYLSTSHLENKYSRIIADVYHCLLFLSFPLVGLLANVWIGRYKAITAGIIMCFLAWIFAGIGYIVRDLFEFSSISFILYGLVYLLELLGYTCLKQILSSSTLIN